MTSPIKWTFTILPLLICFLSACYDGNSIKEHNMTREISSSFLIFDNIYSNTSFKQLVLLLEDMQSGKVETSEHECRGYKSGTVAVENYRIFGEIPVSLFFEFAQDRIWKIKITVGADLNDQSVTNKWKIFFDLLKKNEVKYSFIDNTIYIEILSVRDMVYDFIRKNR